MMPPINRRCSVCRRPREPVRPVSRRARRSRQAAGRHPQGSAGQRLCGSMVLGAIPLDGRAEPRSSAAPYVLTHWVYSKAYEHRPADFGRPARATTECPDMRPQTCGVPSPLPLALALGLTPYQARLLNQHGYPSPPSVVSLGQGTWMLRKGRAAPSSLALFPRDGLELLAKGSLYATCLEPGN